MWSVIDLTVDSPPPAELEIQNAESVSSDKSPVLEGTEAQLSFPWESPSQSLSKPSIRAQTTPATVSQTQQAQQYTQSQSKSCQFAAENAEEI